MSSRAKSVVERSDKACGMWKFGKEGLFAGESGNFTTGDGFAIGSGTKCGGKWIAEQQNKKRHRIDQSAVRA